MKKVSRFLVLALVLSFMFSTVAFAAEFDLTSEYVEELTEQQSGGVVKAPAPQLTQMYVYAVVSDDAGLEYINNSSSSYVVSTTDDHGGNTLYVYVLEIGYAGNRTATFNGNPMTMSDLIPVDINSDSIVDGYLVEWKYTDNAGFNSGYFSATSKSINYPYTQKNIYNFRIR